GAPGRRSKPSALFFELFFPGRAETGRWTKGLAAIEKREVGHVTQIRAAGRFAFQHHEHRAARGSLTKRETASASEMRVGESLHVSEGIILHEGNEFLFEHGLRRDA